MKAALYAAALVLFADHASAVTLNFDNLTYDDTNPTTYVEQGFTMVGNGDIGMYGTGRYLHFDDGGTSAPSTVTFTGKKPFNAKSFDLQPLTMEFEVCDVSGCTFRAYDNVLVQGFRGNKLVSSLLFYMGGDLSQPYPSPFSQVLLGPAFRKLTSMSISVVLPPRIPNSNCLSSPCSHFNVDNVTLAPVPLPASAPLLAFGLLTLLLGYRRRGQNSRLQTH